MNPSGPAVCVARTGRRAMVDPGARPLYPPRPRTPRRTPRLPPRPANSIVEAGQRRDPGASCGIAGGKARDFCPPEPIRARGFCPPEPRRPRDFCPPRTGRWRPRRSPGFASWGTSRSNAATRSATSRTPPASSSSGTKRLQDNIEVISMYRVLASVTGAALSDREFDVETWINQRFRDAGCPEDDTVTTSGSEIVRDLYSHKSGTRRRQVLEALDRLVEATVTLPGLDPATARGRCDQGRASPPDRADRHRRGSQALEAGTGARRGRSPSRSVARLKGNPTLTIQLPRWKAAALRAGHGKTL